MPITHFERTSLIDMLTQSQWRAEYEHHIGWHNYTQNEQSSQSIVISVKTVEALQHLMRTIHDLNNNKMSNHRITVRVAAGGRTRPSHLSHSESFSFSPLVKADIILQLTGPQFAQVTRVSPTSSRVIAGASLQVGELDQILYEKMQLTTPTSSLIPYVTVAGLASTGGHGTGRDQPSFSGLIRSMTLCLPNGELVTVDQSHPDFEVIRGANLGLFGIVTQVELECIRAKKMRCIKEVCSVPDFLDHVSAGLFRKNEYVSVMYMPTYDENELTNRSAKNVLVMRFEPTSLSTANVNHHPEWNRLAQELSIDLQNNLDVADLLREEPKLIPSYMRYLVTKSQIGEKDSIAVGPWYDIMHYQTDFPTDLDEFCALIPVKDHPSAKDDDHPEIRDAFTQVVHRLQAHASKGEYPITYAVYLRFLTGTNGGLSITQHHKQHHVCTIDMTTNKNIVGWSEFKKNISDYFINERQAKCHWGKNIFPNVDYAAMYDRSYYQFTRALTEWYHAHDLTLMASPFITAALNHALKLPCPLHEPHTEVTPLARTLSEKERRKKAVLMMRALDPEIKAAEPLKHELRRIVDRGSSSHSQSFFSDISLSLSDDKAEKHTPPKKAHRRCTIL